MGLNYKVLIDVIAFFTYLFGCAVGIPFLFYDNLHLKGFWIGFLVGGLEIGTFLIGYVLLIRRYYARE